MFNSSSEKNSHLNISWTALWKVAFIGLLVYLAYFLREVILILLTSIVLGSAVRPFSGWFEKYKIPRVFAVLLVYIIGFSVVLGTLYFMIPPVFGDIMDIAKTLPTKINSFVHTNEAWGQVSNFSGDFIDDFSLTELINSNAGSYLPAVPSNIMELIRFLFNGIFSKILFKIKFA